MAGNKRVPVTLRFSRKDITILTYIVQTELGTSNLSLGLRTILLNTIQAYLNNIKKDEADNKNIEKSGNSSNIEEGTDSNEGNSRNSNRDSEEERGIEGTDSKVLAD